LTWLSFSTICTSRSASNDALKIDLLEKIGRDEAGARKRRKNPAGPQDIRRHAINVLVAARRPYHQWRHSNRGLPHRIWSVKFSTTS